jgi:hypothetical protein
MSRTDRLRHSAGVCRQLTGITPAAFDRLLSDLEPQYAAAGAKRKARSGRRRKPAAGWKHALPLADRLLLLLMSYRTYTTHAVLRFLFGVDDSTVGRNINPLQPLLAGTFRIPNAAGGARPREPAGAFLRRHRAADPVAEAVRQREEEAAHPQASGGGDPAAEADRAGGKPRRVRTAAVSGAFPGKTHDKKVYDRPRVIAPPGVRRAGDTGYVGTPLETPTRRPRGG